MNISQHCRKKITYYTTWFWVETTTICQINLKLWQNIWNKKWRNCFLIKNLKFFLSKPYFLFSFILKPMLLFAEVILLARSQYFVCYPRWISNLWTVVSFWSNVKCENVIKRPVLKRDDYQRVLSPLHLDKMTLFSVARQKEQL